MAFTGKAFLNVIFKSATKLGRLCVYNKWVKEIDAGGYCINTDRCTIVYFNINWLANTSNISTPDFLLRTSCCGITVASKLV